MPKNESKFKPIHDVLFKFSVSRVAEGPFKNLWQLKVQTPEDTTLVEEIDADSLNTVIDRIAYIFESEGF